MKEGKQVAEFVDGVPLGSLKGKLRDLAIKDLQKNFAADALLANWDVVGLSEDNVIVDKDGKAHRVDNGGSLDYRAQGKKKPFGPEVNELKTMRNPSYSAGKVFGGLSDSDVAMQIKDLVDKETAILAAAPPGQKSTIVKRLAYMDKWADDVLGKEQTPAPSAWKPTGHKVADAFGKFVGKGPVTLAKPAAGKSFTGEVVDVKPQSKSSALVTLQRPDGSKYQVILGQKAASHAKGTSKSKVGKKTPLGKAIAKQKPKVQAQVATPAAVSEYTGNRTARWKALGMDKSFKTEHGVDWKAGGQPPPPVKTAWRQAAKSYTNSSFSLNKGLYSGNKLSPALKKRQKALDEYVEAHGVEKEVMRRIPPRHGSKTIERYKAALANGHDVVEPGFLSTTSGGFAQGSFVKMRIRARKALNVSSQTKHPGEQEYVLGSGQRFRVLQIEEKKGGYTTIHVEQLI